MFSSSEIINQLRSHAEVRENQFYCYFFFFLSVQTPFYFVSGVVVGCGFCTKRICARILNIFHCDVVQSFLIIWNVSRAKQREVYRRMKANIVLLFGSYASQALKKRTLAQTFCLFFFFSKKFLSFLLNESMALVLACWLMATMMTVLRQTHYYRFRWSGERQRTFFMARVLNSLNLMSSRRHGILRQIQRIAKCWRWRWLVMLIINFLHNCKLTAQTETHFWPNST